MEIVLWSLGSLIVGFVVGALVVNNTKNGVSAKLDKIEAKLDSKIEQVKTKIDNKTGF